MVIALYWFFRPSGFLHPSGEGVQMLAAGLNAIYGGGQRSHQKENKRKRRGKRNKKKEGREGEKEKKREREGRARGKERGGKRMKRMRNRGQE